MPQGMRGGSRCCEGRPCLVRGVHLVPQEIHGGGRRDGSGVCEAEARREGRAGEDGVPNALARSEAPFHAERAFGARGTRLVAGLVGRALEDVTRRRDSLKPRGAFGVWRNARRVYSYGVGIPVSPRGEGGSLLLGLFLSPRGYFSHL